MTTTATRPTAVDGLVVHGWPGHYRIHATLSDETSLPVETGPANNFPRIRDAKAAAVRLDGVLPWGSPTLQDEVRARDHVTTRWAIIEGLTGMTREQIEERDRRERAIMDAHYDGTGARDFYDALLRDLGHAVTWKKKGQRTYWGTCDRCDVKFRSSYNSMSDSFSRVGAALRCEP